MPPPSQFVCGGGFIYFCANVRAFCKTPILSIKKPRKSLDLRGEDDDDEKAGGVEMGGAPPAALKEWFCCDDAKVAKLSYMRRKTFI